MYIALDQNSRLALIQTVKRGLACACRCIVCGEPVIARQGEVREWHFAHVSNREDCLISGETVLHLLVKQCIQDGNGLKIPDRPIGRALPAGLELAVQDGWLSFDRIELELALDGVRPDLVGFRGQDRLAIEVGYSSFCDWEKTARLEALGLSTLEIDVRNFDPMNYDEDVVRHAVLAQVERKRWIHCSETMPPPISPAGATEPKPRGTREHLMSVIIGGRAVSLSRLPWGQLAVKYEWGDMVCRLVRERVGHRFHGKWNGQYKNWTFKSCWERELREGLLSLSNETIDTGG